MQKISDELRILESKGNLRKIPSIDYKIDGKIIIDGVEYVNFASNDLVQNLPNEYFNCHECDNVVIVPPVIIPTAPEYPSYSYDISSGVSPSSGPGGNDNDSNKTKKKGLSVGAIVGIVIGVVVVVAAIVVLIVIILLKRRNPNDIRSEQVSQEVDNGIYSLGEHPSTDFNTDNPIWAATNDSNANQIPDDPFMKNFEESTM